MIHTQALQIPWPLFSLSGAFTGRLLSSHDGDMVLNFRTKIFANLPTEFRVADPELDDIAGAELQWAREHLCKTSVTLGIFHHRELIAFASLVLPQNGTAHPGNPLIGLADAQSGHCAHLAACMVAENFRGMHLQTKLIHWRRSFAIRAGRSLLVSMTACGNRYSLRNLLSAGLSIRWIGERGPGRWWYALAVDLEADAEAPTRLDPIWVHGDDYPQQVALTRQGFEGVAETLRPDTHGRPAFYIAFARRSVMAPVAVVAA